MATLDSSQEALLQVMSVNVSRTQTNTLLIFVAIACIFHEHEAPLLPFFFYLSLPKTTPLALYLTSSTWYATR